MSQAQQFAVLSVLVLVWASLLATVTNAQVIVGQEDENEFAYYVDVNTAAATPLFKPADAGITVAGVEGLTADDANRTIYWSTGSGVTDSAIYSVHYDDRDSSFTGTLRVRTVSDIIYQGSLQRVTGLAYDTANGKMYATDPFQGTSTGPEGIYEIDLTTGVSTQVVDLGPVSSNWELRGLDYNPADGLLYATNTDSTPNGTGLFSIDLNGAGDETALSLVTALVGTNIRGLAIGNNKAYIVEDDPGVIRVFNIGTGLFEADINPNPWSGSTIDAGGGWGPGALVQPAGANLAVFLTPDIDPSVDLEVGNSVVYTIVLANFGPDDATNVSFSATLSGTASANITNLTSTSGTAVESPPGTVTAAFANFPAGAGSTETITITVETTATGDLVQTADFTPGGEADGYLGNNTEATSHTVRSFPPVELIFTTIASSPKSDVPGLPGAKFGIPIDQFNLKFRTPGRSPDGRFIGLWADTDLAGTIDEVFMLGDNGSFTVALQEGVTATTDGDLLRTMILNPWISVNNAGQFAIANNTSTFDETILTWTGTDLVAVAREGDVVPAFAAQGYTYPGFSLDSPNITTNGEVAFRVDGMVGAPSNQNEALLGGDGSTVIAQEGLDIPSGQAGGGTDPYTLFFDHRFWTDESVSNWLTHARVNTGNVNTDEVLVVNGQVMLQESQIIPGSGFTTGIDINTSSIASNSKSIVFPKMLSNGDWFCRGTNIDPNEDWLVRGNGATFSVLARKGDEIFPGAGEHWDDVGGGESWNRTFIAAAGNNQGDYIIIGRTDRLDTRRNTVAVLNMTTEVLREGDPVDLDDNGMFDDNMFIRFFTEAGAVLTDDGDLYCTVDLTDNSGGGLSGVFLGKALVRLPLVQLPCPLLGDWDCDGDVDRRDFLHLPGCMTGPDAGPVTGDCGVFDFNGDGDIDLDDFGGFQAAFLGGA